MASKKNATESAGTSAKKYDNTLWSKPHKRAKGYAAERKNMAHAAGAKKGQPLTDYESGLRSGYLQCQHDHAGFWKYRKARELGYTKREASEMSKKPWDKDTPPKEKKGA